MRTLSPKIPNNFIHRTLHEGVDNTLVEGQEFVEFHKEANNHSPTPGDVTIF